MKKDIWKSEKTGLKICMPTNKSFFTTMLRSEMLQWRLNKTPIWNIPLRNFLIKKIVARVDGNPFCMVPPCYFQEGNNTYIRKEFLQWLRLYMP